MQQGGANQQYAGVTGHQFEPASSLPIVLGENQMFSNLQLFVLIICIRTGMKSLVKLMKKMVFGKER